MEQLYLQGLDGENFKSKHDELVEFLNGSKHSSWISQLKKNTKLYELFLKETEFLPKEAGNSERKYCVINGIHERVRCAECHENFVKFGVHGKYNEFCSGHCASINLKVREKVNLTNLKNFGVGNPMQSPAVKEKLRTTNLKRYGVEYASQSPEVKEKTRLTNLKNFGVANVFQSEEIKNKSRLTNLKNRGVAYASQSPEVKEKARTTNLKRRGVGNPMQSPTVKEKARTTNLKRHGVEYALQSPEVKEKVRTTNLKRHGVEYASQSPEVKEKVRTTNLKRRGVEYASQSPEVKEKARTTNLKRRGVEYPTQSEDVKNKVRKTNFIRRGVEYPLQNEDVKAKVRMKNIEHFGVGNVFQSEEIKLKSYKTLKQKYGPDRMPNVSKGEKELRQECKAFYDGEIIFNEREVLGHGREFDLWFPAFRFAIEFDGKYWHSKPDNIKADKWKNTRCRNLNIMLLRVSDKEWKLSKEDVINSLKVIFKVLTSCQDDVKQKLHEVLFNRLENQMPFGELSAELSQLVHQIADRKMPPSAYRREGIL